jgi:hypothetical protein
MSYSQPQPALPMVSGNRWAMVLRGIAAVLFVGNWVSGTRKEKMNRNYAALRLWSTVLTIIGVAGVILVVIGTVFAMIEAVTFLQALAILLIGGPLAALFASWPIALGQGLRALADVAEYVQDQQRSVR